MGITLESARDFHLLSEQATQVDRFSQNEPCAYNQRYRGAIMQATYTEWIPVYFDCGLLRDWISFLGWSIVDKKDRDSKSYHWNGYVNWVPGLI